MTWSETQIWEVFSILHTSRSIGMEVSGISIVDIAALQSTTPESLIDLVRIIKRLDSIWLTWNSKQSKKNAPAKH